MKHKHILSRTHNNLPVIPPSGKTTIRCKWENAILSYPEPKQKVTCAGPKILQSKFTLSVRVTPKVNRKFSMQIYLSFVFCLALDSFPRWTVHVWGLLKQANINSLPHHCPVRTSSLHIQTTCPCHTLFTTTKAALTHLSWLNSFAYEKLKFWQKTNLLNGKTSSVNCWMKNPFPFCNK